MQTCMQTYKLSAFQHNFENTACRLTSLYSFNIILNYHNFETLHVDLQSLHRFIIIPNNLGTPIPPPQVQLNKNLRSQLLTDQHLPYTSVGSAREVDLYTWVLQVGSTVYGDVLDKLDMSCPILRTSTSVLLRPLQGVVVLLLRDIAMLTITRQ